MRCSCGQYYFGQTRALAESELRGHIRHSHPNDVNRRAILRVQITPDEYEDYKSRKDDPTFYHELRHTRALAEQALGIFLSA